MKKYVPSIKSNNQLKDQVIGELKALLYRLERGKYDSGIDRDTIARIIDDLKNDTEFLDHTVGTGDEKVDTLANNILTLTKALKKQSDLEMVHRIEETAEELDFNINMWKDALDGVTVIPADDRMAEAKVSFSRRRLNAKLFELNEIKESFSQNARRLEKEISGYEKDLSELDAAILAEDNERKINDLYRKIAALKAKTDALVVRKSNYSSCFDLLDMIYVNAAEIVEASDFAGEEIGKAKALLNMGKLRKVLSEPDKALIILKRMQADIKEVCDRTKSIDEKIVSSNMSTTTVSNDALTYKEELMRKKHEKERLAQSTLTISESENTTDAAKTAQEDN